MMANFSGINFTLLLTIASFLSSNCLSYDYKQSQRELWGRFMYRDNWEYLSDNEDNTTLLRSKAAARSCTVESIPVMVFDYNLYAETKNLKNSYKPDKRFFMGFLLANTQPIWILQSGNGTKHAIGGQSKNILVFYKAKNDSGNCLYFDNTFYTLAYFKKEDLFLWHSKENRFIDVQTAINVYKWRNIFANK